MREKELMNRRNFIGSFSRPTFFASIAVIGLIFTFVPFVLAQVQTDQPTAIVTVGQMNVREGPGAGYLPITTVSQGETVTLLGRNADASWVQVKLIDGTTGWVSTLHIVTTYKVVDLPIVNSTAEPYGAIATGRLNMRTGPGVNYPISSTLTHGDVVSLLGRSSDGRWALIRAFSIDVGWVNSGYLKRAVPMSVLPLEDATFQTSPPLGVVPHYGTGIAVTSPTNVSQGPDPASALLTALPSRANFKLAGRDATMTRIKILMSNGSVGWVNAGDIGSSIPYMYLPVLQT
jgi:uncharacterized protein YgiM (DUF1202 family)